MFTKRSFYLLMIVVSIIITACAPQVEVMPTPTSLPEMNTPQVEMTTTEAPSPTATVTSEPHWNLVVVGDSIPFNSPEDCPGCKGFVAQYAEAITAATGRAVKVQNLSQHNGLDIDGFLKELGNDTARREALAKADIILASIAHNSTAWNRDDDLCDGPNGDNPDWLKYNIACATATAEMFRPKFESAYSQIVSLRGGKPTIFRTINVYNEWIGWPGHDIPPEANNATKLFLDAWNKMVCKAAQENGFTCADIYHAFNGSDGLKPSGNLVVSDYTHPSDKGNEVIVKALEDLGYAPLMP